MVLQGTIAITFSVAFASLWRGFHRRAALRFAVAWLVYGLGVWLAAAGITGVALAFGVFGLPLRVAGLPLQWGTVLFRAGVDALRQPESPPGAARYALACAVMTGLWLLAGVAAVVLSPAVPLGPAGIVYPRFLLGLGFAWSVWPLLTPLRERGNAVSRLLRASLVLLSLRMFAAVVYDLWQIRAGSFQPIESPLLSILQVSLLTLLGLATTRALTESEARALRDAEEGLRFVVEHSSDVQVLTGLDRRLRFVAPSCERVLGEPASALQGRDLLELVHEEDRAELRNAFSSVAEDPRRAWPLRTLRMGCRGEWRELDVSGRIVERDPPEGTAIVLSLRDVTEQHRLEAALLKTQRMESLGRMAGSIAHDFNNTLTAVTILEQEMSLQTAEEQAPLRDELRAVVARGTALTRQLLSFARQHRVDPEPFDAAERIRSLKPMLSRAVGRGVAVTIEAGAGPHDVHADPHQFDQVMLNLAINARDAMPDGGRLTVRIASVPDPAPEPEGNGPRVRVELADTGVGIPAEHLSRIFEPFFTTKPPEAGTGLGLAAAYGFARQAGGDLSVRSAPGRGACFVLELPLAR